MAPPEQGVPPAAPMPQQPERLEGFVPQADMDRLRSEYDRRNWEAEQRARQAEAALEQERLVAQTAGMDEEEKYKFLYQQTQTQMQEQQRQMEEFQNLIQWQYTIASEAGIDPGQLNPMEGYYGMIRRAFELTKARPAQPPKPQWPQQQPPSQAQPSQPPTAQPLQPPRAPSAPSSPASQGGFIDEYNRLPLHERYKKIPKGRGYSELMESLGEEEE